MDVSVMVLVLESVTPRAGSPVTDTFSATMGSIVKVARSVEGGEVSEDVGTAHAERDRIKVTRIDFRGMDRYFILSKIKWLLAGI